MIRNTSSYESIRSGIEKVVQKEFIARLETFNELFEFHGVGAFEEFDFNQAQIAQWIF